MLKVVLVGEGVESGEEKLENVEDEDSAGEDQVDDESEGVEQALSAGGCVETSLRPAAIWYQARIFEAILE